MDVPLQGGGFVNTLRCIVARLEDIPRGSRQQIAIPYVVYHAGAQRLAHVRSDDSSFAIESSARYWYASAVLCSRRVRHKRLPPVLLYQDDIDNKLSSSSSAMVASPGGVHSGIACQPRPLQNTQCGDTCSPCHFTASVKPKNSESVTLVS